jgi:DNA primase
VIPKEKIEELREKADIVSVISEYVPLKKRGKNYLALCPFHSEKTPSFTVSQEKQLFHCFGCGEGGNVFAFLMKMEKVDFPEAAEILGDKLGIHIERAQGSGAAKSYRERLLDLAGLACKFFENQLDTNQGAAARDYLVRRKLKPETTKTFKLGWAPDSWDSLLNHLQSRGAKVEDLEAAGLVVPRSQKKGHYDRFRGRLMFPLFDPRGRVIGFSGRTLGAEEPKYLNSPDSPIFLKGETLFGIHLAKEEIKKQKFAILVEGNIDVLSIYEAGLKNVVAPLGTALTGSQAGLIKRFAETVILAFDSDAAGGAASERAQEILKEAGLKVRIADLGSAKDPDELIKNTGVAVFIESLKRSKPALEFKIGRILSRYNLAEIESRAQAAYQVAELLAREKDAIIRREYLKRAAGMLKIEEEQLLSEVNRRTFYRRAGGSPASRLVSKPPQKIAEAEKCLIRLAIESEEAFAYIRENISAKDFVDLNCREIMSHLERQPAPNIIEALESPAQQQLVREALMSEAPTEEALKMAEDCISVIRSHNLKKQLEGVRADLLSAECSGNLDSVKKLNTEYNALSEILRSYAR